MEELQKEKEKEKIKDIRERKFRIGELKEELKSQKRELNNLKINQIEKEKKEAIKLKKIIRNVK